MDPVTTIALVTSLALGVPTSRPSAQSVKSRLSTEYVLDRRTVVTPDTTVSGLNEPVFAELLSYKNLANGWDGDGSVAPAASDIGMAVAFVQMLRPYLPTPSAMLSPEGQVGLYWNTPDAYIDINFDRNGTISIYTRDRSHQPNKEGYVDNVDPRDIASLMPIVNLLKPLKLAA